MCTYKVTFCNISKSFPEKLVQKSKDNYEALISCPFPGERYLKLFPING